MLPVLHWHLVADFLALCGAFYALLWWARTARAMRFVLGIIGLRALSLLALRLDLVVASWVLDAAAILAILVLLLVFQPELRRAFMQLDSALNRWPRRVAAGAEASQILSTAAFELAKSQLGALFVLTRRDSIGALLEGGITIGADLSPELLVSIFQKVSPLHDGAAVIAGGRLLRANVVLPLTKRQDIPSFYGTRHRAAIGLAERCDALVLVVSEERTEVTLMDGDRICPMPDVQHLMEALEGALAPPLKTTWLGWSAAQFRNLLFQNVGLKFASVGLAGLIWGMSFLASGSTIRSVSVPIEFSNVPAGMQVAYQSADTLEIQVQGSPWIMDSVSLGKLVARFDLRNIHPGSYSLRFQESLLDLPPGLSANRVTPSTIRVQVAPSSAPSVAGR